jgi:methenyltetrahydrofolate cyclohydrolase
MPDSFQQLSIANFLESLAQGTPSPGGGSAIALAGALAASLTGMVAALTTGRERYAAVNEEMQAIGDQARELRLVFARLADEDAAAFASVIAAHRLPKHSEAEAQERRAAVASALRAAIETPMATAEASVAVLRLAEAVALRGNPSGSSDAAVAALLARAVLLGARQNAQANAQALRDETIMRDTRARLQTLVAAGEAAAASVAAAVPGE